MKFSDGVWYGIVPDISMQQALACHYLERAGQRFCIDFGVDNAIEKARAIRRQSAANRHLIFSRVASQEKPEP